jgi:hypothetical protein
VNQQRTGRIGWTQRLWIVGAICVALLVACGGGGVGTGGTGSFASGPISGFGSIIVNGVHYDDSSARVDDDDGTRRTTDDLRLGMTVEIQANAVRDNAATAEKVRIVSELVGRVDAADSNQLVVNGLAVHTDAGTVFDDRFSGGRAGVHAGSVVEVFGFSSGAAGDVLATRIEPAPRTETYKFHGTLSQVDTRSRTFHIGSQTFVYASKIAGQGQLANDALVRITVAAARDSQGRWVVSSIESGAPAAEGAQDVRANGVITQFNSLASFRVDGWTVDGSSASIEGGPLALGQHVKLEGQLRGGVVTARDVRVLGKDDDKSYETKGRIISIDPNARVFDLDGNRGRISYARNDIVFVRGTLADLALDRRVTVKGQLSADGVLIEAQRIEFDK